MVTGVARVGCADTVLRKGLVNLVMEPSALDAAPDGIMARVSLLQPRALETMRLQARLLKLEAGILMLQARGLLLKARVV